LVRRDSDQVSRILGRKHLGLESMLLRPLSEKTLQVIVSVLEDLSRLDKLSDLVQVVTTRSTIELRRRLGDTPLALRRDLILQSRAR